MRIWVVSLFEPLPIDGSRGMRLMPQAAEMARRGHDLTVWTTSFFHYGKKMRAPADCVRTTDEGYRIRVLRSWGYRRNVSLRRLLAHRHFAARLSTAMRDSEPPDVIVCYFPPIESALVVADYAEEQGIPLVMEVIDPWPDVYMRFAPARATGLVRRGLGPLYQRAERALGRADVVTSLSSEYIAWVRGMGASEAQTEVLYPGVDISAFDAHSDGARREEAPEAITAVYAGSFGRSYDLETILDSAALLDKGRGGSPAPVQFVIAGTGSSLGALQRRAAGLSNVRFTGWLDASALAVLLRSAHVGLACYRADATQTITYKLFDYLSAGLPIVCSLPGEMTQLLTANDIGRACRPEDPTDLADVLLGLCDHETRNAMSARARRFAERHGDARVLSSTFVDLVETARHKTVGT